MLVRKESSNQDILVDKNIRKDRLTFAIFGVFKNEDKTFLCRHKNQNKRKKLRKN